MIKTYALTLSSHDVVEVIVALADRHSTTGGSDESLTATCDSIRDQLNAQGAFDDISRWYGELT